MYFRDSLIAAIVAMMGIGAALAAVSDEEAARLNTDLTPFGAERAGNQDGSIPPWTGGFTKPDPNFRPGERNSHRADFFAEEKPLYLVTSQNSDQYTHILSAGVKKLLEKYPDFSLHVYPAHRSAAAPEWVYENTFKNATTAQLANSNFGIEHAIGGIPFPIPKNAYEVMLNHIASWRGQSVEYTSQCWLVAPNGKLRLSSSGELKYISPYYFPEAAPDYTGYYRLGAYVQDAPPSKAGESILAYNTLNNDKYPRGIWQYLVGQRRVRRAPAISYDTPDTVTSGLSFFDEAFLQFGPWDHHTYALIGKQEMLIPYNNNKANAAEAEDIMGKNYLNPDLVRWELHRVWVIEAKLIPGKRHVVPKRRYYLDEDTWQIILMDGWDAQDNLWRMGYTLTLLAPDVPMVNGSVFWGLYNLLEGGYFINSASFGRDAVQIWENPAIKFSQFTPEELANMGTR
ncbi:MAG: DUF1329 domain-containing protein [Gammaproteobacteria bacterium]